MLAQFALEGRPEELPALVQARYGGLLDRVSFYLPFDPRQEQMWRMWMEALSR
jgi:hypothetical protein